MKQAIYSAFLSVISLNALAQDQGAQVILGVYGGAGASTVYNYNVGINGGFNFSHQLGRSDLFIGGTLFYQGYAFLYDREDHYVNNGGGNAGVSILNKSSYIFLAPKFSAFFGKHGCLEAYVDAGAGFKMSGTETMRKWDYSNGTIATNYDSTINTSKNINSMVIRVGVGLTEYLHLYKNWWFTVTEDAGFLGNTLSKTSNIDDPSRTAYSPNGKLNPNFFSLQIGITHTKYWEEHKVWKEKW